MSPHEFFLHLFFLFFFWRYLLLQWHPTPVLLPGKSHGWRSLMGYVHGVAKSRTRLNDFTLTFHCPALEKEMATHSSVLAWRIPGMGEPGGLPSMGSHRVGHDWSDLAAVAAAFIPFFFQFPHMLPVCSWRLWTINTWPSQITFAVWSRARITHESYIIQETEQIGKIWSFSLFF